ncbi:hypothetical protein [Geomonas agri]|uniref:hypothetical protein n=1 Tax=Geomonas agri TaxID=2873702 RepID=UPI001CD28CFC|nr:hypothetical protein [Geomonas agri]
MLARKTPTPYDIVGWAMNNYIITLDKLEPEEAGALLYLAKKNPDEFQQLMVLGLKLRLHEEVGSNIIAQPMKCYISECKIKVALAVTLLNCAGRLPPIPLFSMSFLDEYEHRVLCECELLTSVKFRRRD